MADGTLAKLKELGALKDQGILTEIEFAAQKATLLSVGAVPQGQLVPPSAPPLVTLADPAEQRRREQEHELKLEKMKLEAKQEENRRQEQLAAERMSNQLMLAQTAQTAAAQASAAPVVVNNNNNNNMQMTSQIAPVQAAPVVVQVQGAQFYADPGCCMKCCCPVCAVCTTYGTCCKCPQMLLALLLCCSYTLCCWSPSTEQRS